MDSYAVDAVAFLAYLVDLLPPKVNDIFTQAENRDVNLIIPSIALGEVLYTIYKGKEIFGKKIPPQKIELISSVLESAVGFNLIDMDQSCWRTFQKLDIPGLHNRMIAAIAITYKEKALISNDREIASKTQTLWE